jgi:hypothetical protein
MARSYSPDAGDVVWVSFNPQAIELREMAATSADPD